MGIAANQQFKKLKWEDDPYLNTNKQMASAELAQYNANPTQNMAYIQGNNELMQALRMMNEQQVRNRARMGGTSEGALASQAGLGELAVKGRMDLFRTGLNAREQALAKFKDASAQVANNQRQKMAFNAAKAEKNAQALAQLGQVVSQSVSPFISGQGAEQQKTSQQTKPKPYAFT